jgi:Fe-S cluster assembly protein SufB
MTQTQAPGLGATQDEHLEALGNYRFGWHDKDAAGAARDVASTRMS